MSSNRNQFLMNVKVMRMDLDNLSASAECDEYGYSFTISSEVPVDEMSKSAIYRQLVGTLNNILNQKGDAADADKNG